MNLYAVRAIYLFEMARTGRTLLQSIVSPVISTALYFVVFGAAIGSRITEIEGVSYGAFIVPGLIMLTLLTQSVMNASFGIYFPKFVGTIYELLSAPISYVEIVLGYVGAAATKSIILGLIIPTEATIVPLYYDVQALGLIDTYWALIILEVSGEVAFGIFWMRAAFLSAPPSLLEAARIDGARMRCCVRSSRCEALPPRICRAFGP